MRIVLLAAVLFVIAGAAAGVLLLRPASPPAPAVAPAVAAPEAAPPHVPTERELAREKIAQLKRAMENAPRPRKVTISSPDRRPGEPQTFFEERQRAIAEFNHFAKDGGLTPDQVDAVAGIIADAQDTWRNGLVSLGKRQPEAVGAEMADPVLSQLVMSINEEAQRAAREVVPPASAAILHSYFPSMLPYVRTQVFETAKQ